MRYSTLGLILLIAFGITAGAWAQGKKAIADKDRIAALEIQVAALSEKIAGDEAYVDALGELFNKRTLDLHGRVLRLESRGPVAGVR